MRDKFTTIIFGILLTIRCIMWILVAIMPQSWVQRARDVRYFGWRALRDSGHIAW